MNYYSSEMLGFAAGIVTTLALLPQALKIFTTRKTRDISLLWAVSMNVGIVLWLCYGLAKDDLPMIAANSVSLALLFVILLFKLRYR
ncbi:MAG: SemiSWEET transporter [Chlorobium sp.]|jgi:MtN3 and saliva related transmembrane protein|uniref:SemiSWEET transporter n=1 Tax=Chlorobium sp. TaxID=1095 RepID=UPI0025C0C078|nr:SemiSWEET transporter [Chlorobium sp.]MCF8216665.1 SemiSWEET transporter [Chlorobium sp.]MCF8270874.1 SemiSWEET transporter [Chlorobium sp.]MCF8287192.1 SemiSWEET transporter [Chlorobium sp.]MCF8290849.1 SemiSWEET transporter [Chlorobium sp.]MCF8385634.1 SemiSWEET transporter [Chlorobium sp.]